jgi:hypothetical protein
MSSSRNTTNLPPLCWNAHHRCHGSARRGVGQWTITDSFRRRHDSIISRVPASPPASLMTISSGGSLCRISAERHLVSSRGREHVAMQTLKLTRAPRCAR